MIPKKSDPREPVRSRYIGWAQLVEMTGIRSHKVHELIELGWIEATQTGDEDYLFRLKDAYRITKLERLCKDLDVTTAGGTIIVDLLERIEQLEQRVDELTKLK